MKLFRRPSAAQTALMRAIGKAFLAPKAARQPKTPSTAATFGTNPGALRMHVFAPPSLRAGRPLVVVLHGCRQDPSTFATETGWIALARLHGFALLLPEQTHENNKARCFNWFLPDDTRRGAGEAMSIRQMIRAAILRFGSNPKQVFIAGFSAGGGMAAAMLAAYPAVFAAGAVIAGMPVGCATTQMGAMIRMRTANTHRPRSALANDVRAAARAPTRKRWPRLSIWQGAKDRTVDPANAETLAAQWSELHGFAAHPTTDTDVQSHRHRTWGRPNRAPAVDLWTLETLGHGYPGTSQGAWVELANISATRHIASFWGLT